MFKIALIILLVYALAGLFLFIKQRQLMYYPTAAVERPDIESSWLENDGQRLKIWQLNSGGPAILYFGGNAEAVEENLDNFQRIFGNYSVYLMNYRGFGGSSGAPTEQGLFNDALKLYDRVRASHSEIHVIGRSLGSGVACYLAEQREVSKLVLITPYDSIRQLAQSTYPMYPIGWMLKDHFDSLSRAGKLQNDILILLAEKDQVVPHRHSYHLITGLSRATTQTHIVPATQHNDILAAADALQHLQDFFQSINEHETAGDLLR